MMPLSTTAARDQPHMGRWSLSPPGADGDGKMRGSCVVSAAMAADQGGERQQSLELEERRGRARDQGLSKAA
jgi:hypothetical protein